MTGRRRHRRLFWRVYGHGLLLLALVALAVAGAGALLNRGRWMRNPEHLAGYAAYRVAEARSDPARISEELDRAREAFGVEISVYGPGGTLLGSNVKPPVPPLDPAARARLARGAFRVGGRRWALAAPVPGDPPAYVLLSGPPRPFALAHTAALLGVVLVALALGSIPLARGIAAPLERLTAAARGLGAGDLSTRARLRRRRRDEVTVLGEAFDEMAERLERLVRSERELLVSVSHELRTPLARIRVALDLAAEGDLARARRFLAEIGADLSELEGLVEDVLTAARLDAGEGHPANALPLRREAVDAAELLRDSAERFRAAHPQRSLELRLAEPLPSIEADPALLRRALANLLDNARKYSEPSDPVALSGGAEAGLLRVEVRDRGIGIEPEDLPRIFTPFFRSDRSRARASGGVGLGLALAKRIVEAHGGTITVESAPGQGTAVRLTLPQAAEKGGPAPGGTGAALPAGGAS